MSSTNGRSQEIAKKWDRHFETAKAMFDSRPAVQIRKVGETLVSEFQQLQEMWELAEQKLSSSHVPCPVQIACGQQPIVDDDTDSQIGAEETYLSFRRHKSQWRICYGCCRSKEEGTQWRPITEVAVYLRIAMIPHFRKLESEVIEKAEDFVPTIKKAVEELKYFVK